ALMSRPATVLVNTRMRSARVDFPWSMWATMQKFRILSILMMEPSGVRGTRSATPELGAGGGRLPDVAGFQLPGGPEGGAQPAGVVARHLGGLDSDLLDEYAENAALDAF